MAPVGTRRIIWQGGEHDFCLAPIGHLLSLEENCKAGIGLIFHRLQNGTWGINDVREPIRLGLIGGGLSPREAMDLVKAHVDAHHNGLAPSVMVAMAIISAVLIGVPDDPVGKTQAAEAATGPNSSIATAASAAPDSTESAPL